MLSASQDRAYQDFLTLLTKFNQIAIAQEQEYNLGLLKTEFSQLSQWFEFQIATISDRQIAPDYAARWQSVQTEILREFRLLSTDLLFLASARQNSTQQKRIESIKKRLSKSIGYCEIILKRA